MLQMMVAPQGKLHRQNAKLAGGGQWWGRKYILCTACWLVLAKGWPISLSLFPSASQLCLSHVSGHDHHHEQIGMHAVILYIAAYSFLFGVLQCIFVFDDVVSGVEIIVLAVTLLNHISHCVDTLLFFLVAKTPYRRRSSTPSVLLLTTTMCQSFAVIFAICLVPFCLRQFSIQVGGILLFHFFVCPRRRCTLSNFGLVLL
jgi:hypothetical protein